MPLLSSHCLPSEHLPQLPPQPSLPHSLTPQTGWQPAQAPTLQVLPEAVQSTQSAPAFPQLESSVPATQRPALVQQPLQTSGSQAHSPVI